MMNPICAGPWRISSCEKVIGSVNMYFSKKMQNRLQSTMKRDVECVEIIADLLRRACFVHSNFLLQLTAS